jgi:hypothetical protein
MTFIRRHGRALAWVLAGLAISALTYESPF